MSKTRGHLANNCMVLILLTSPPINLRTSFLLQKLMPVLSLGGYHYLALSAEKPESSSRRRESNHRSLREIEYIPRGRMHLMSSPVTDVKLPFDNNLHFMVCVFVYQCLSSIETVESSTYWCDWIVGLRRCNITQEVICVCDQGWLIVLLGVLDMREGWWCRHFFV